MRKKDRKWVRKDLDKELQPFRRAGMDGNPTNGLLRAVRLALRIPIAEVAGKLGVHRSLIFKFEQGELKQSITLDSLARVATAMECKVVYGIVPRNGMTLEQLAELREWEEVVKDREREKEEARERGNRKGLESRTNPST